MGYHLDDFWEENKLSRHSVDEFVKQFARAGTDEYTCTLINRLITSLGYDDIYRGLKVFFEATYGLGWNDAEGDGSFLIHQSDNITYQVGRLPKGYKIIREGVEYSD